MHNPPMVRPVAIEQRSPHNRVVALLLFLFLGWAGVHRFYVGKTGSGVAMLLLTLFTGVLGLVWWIVDLALLATGRFTDAEGRVLGPPQIEHRLPHHPVTGQFEAAQREQRLQRLPTHEPELAPVKATEDPILDELLRDPLEDEFAELERKMNQEW